MSFRSRKKIDHFLSAGKSLAARRLAEACGMDCGFRASFGSGDVRASEPRPLIFDIRGLRLRVCCFRLDLCGLPQIRGNLKYLG